MSRKSVPVKNDNVEIAVEVFAYFRVLTVVDLEGWFNRAVWSDLSKQFLQMFLTGLEIVQISDRGVVFQNDSLRPCASREQVRDVAII